MKKSDSEIIHPEINLQIIVYRIPLDHNGIFTINITLPGDVTGKGSVGDLEDGGLGVRECKGLSTLSDSVTGMGLKYFMPFPYPLCDFKLPNFLPI